MPKTHKKRQYAKKKHYARKTKTQAGYVSASAREMLVSLDARMRQNIAQVRQSIAIIAPILFLKSRQYKDFINTVSTSYEYNHKNIPIVLLRLIPHIHIVLERVNHLLRLHSEPAFLEAELARNGYNDIITFIGVTVSNIRELDIEITRYRQNSLTDYKWLHLGVETQPAMRNRITRRTDAIVRRPYIERTLALTRRTRSI